MSLERFQLAERLAAQQQADRYRRRLTHSSPSGATLRVAGREYLNFSGNDYLGLANHPQVVAAFCDATRRFGVGSGASHLVTGHSDYHQQLEEKLAAFLGYPRVLLCSTGFMANTGVLQALLSAPDAVFEDRLNHASLLDGGLHSGARFRRYAHKDVRQLERLLEKSTAEKKLIVTDGVFSMDGDVAPVEELASLATQTASGLMVDDAHGIGVFGAKGEGLVSSLQLQSAVDILVGTLGKAFGTFGAFVAGSEALVEFLIQTNRAYIFTTALPPAVAAASLAALEIMQADNERRAHLHHLIALLRTGLTQQGFALLPSDSAIQPLLLGDNARALAASEALKQRGFWVTAIRPPTVPEGTARLRITLSAAHSVEQIEQLIVALSQLKQAGIL